MSAFLGLSPACVRPFRPACLLCCLSRLVLDGVSAFLACLPACLPPNQLDFMYDFCNCHGVFTGGVIFFDDLRWESLLGHVSRTPSFERLMKFLPNKKKLKDSEALILDGWTWYAFESLLKNGGSMYCLYHLA